MQKRTYINVLWFIWNTCLFFFRWDILVVCPVLFLKRAVTVLTNLYSRTLWPNWYNFFSVIWPIIVLNPPYHYSLVHIFGHYHRTDNFFWSFRKKFGVWPKKKRDTCIARCGHNCLLSFVFLFVKKKFGAKNAQKWEVTSFRIIRSMGRHTKAVICRWNEMWEDVIDRRLKYLVAFVAGRAAFSVPNLFRLTPPYRRDNQFVARSSKNIATCYEVWWHFETVVSVIYWKMYQFAASRTIVNGNPDCRCNPIRIGNHWFKRLLLPLL